MSAKLIAEKIHELLDEASVIKPISVQDTENIMKIYKDKIIGGSIDDKNNTVIFSFDDSSVLKLKFMDTTVNGKSKSTIEISSGKVLEKEKPQKQLH